MTGCLQKQLCTLPLCQRPESLHLDQILPVHGQQQVEIFKILPYQLPRTQTGQINTAQACGCYCTGIRWLANVIVTGAC